MEDRTESLTYPSYLPYQEFEFSNCEGFYTFVSHCVQEVHHLQYVLIGDVYLNVACVPQQSQYKLHRVHIKIDLFIHRDCVWSRQHICDSHDYEDSFDNSNQHPGQPALDVCHQVIINIYVVLRWLLSAIISDDSLVL